MQLQYGTTIASHGQLWLSVLRVHAVQVGEGQEGAGVESSGLHESASGMQHGDRGFTSH